MKEDFRFALMLAVVISPCVIVGNVLSQFFAGSMNQPAPTCPGECCPCDAVDAHVVAKWLSQHRSDVAVWSRESKAGGYQHARCQFLGAFASKNDVDIIFAVADGTDTGEAPVGELEGDE